MTDAVVIGAGPNGLVAANVLADRGWKVLVLEAAPTIGGAASSAPLIEPGFVNDRCSAFYPLGATPIAPLAELGLEDWGLTWCHAPVVVAHPAPDGSCPILTRGVDGTAAPLASIEPGDGERWRQLHDRWRSVGAPLLHALLRPFPPVRAAAHLTWAGRADLVGLARFLLLPARQMTREAGLGPAASRLL